MASPGQKLMVDLAFNLFPDEVQGDPNFWLDLDENDPAWNEHFRPALSRGAQALHQKVKAGGGTHDHDGRYVKSVEVSR